MEIEETGIRRLALKFRNVYYQIQKYLLDLKENRTVMNLEVVWVDRLSGKKVT